MAPPRPTSLSPLLLLLAAAACSLLPGAAAFDQRELQLFDLVEEVNGNFYDLLGTHREASGPEIRRAFRRVSMQYHPDRLNKHDEATVDYFRKLNAINEVLKDETLRLRYNEILDNGLPDWRSPVFYYRKWRKMSLLEVLLVLSVAFSVGHYLVLWGVYFERRLELDDLFRRKRKKKQKQIEAEMEPLCGPTWRDALPLALARGLWGAVVGAPETLRSLCAAVADWRDAGLEQRRAEAAEAEAIEEEARRREQRKQQKKERREQQFEKVQRELLAEQERMAAAGASSKAPPSTMMAAASSAAEGDEAEQLVEGPWTDAEQQLLVRAVSRFPSGTPGRWEKIARLLHRSVNDVTARAREAEQQMRKQAAASLNAAFEIGTSGAAVCGESDEASSSEADSDDEDASTTRSRRRRRNRRKEKKAEPTTTTTTQRHADASAATSAAKADLDDGGEADGDAKSAGRHRPWSQAEQSQLEAALRQFPKGTRDRWDRVSEAVASRSAEECAKRCKVINEQLRLKKD